MTKYKVNINRPEVSSKEIFERKDFDIVLKKFKKEKRKVLKTNWIIIYLLVIIILLCVFLAVRIIKSSEEKKGYLKKDVPASTKARISD